MKTLTKITALALAGGVAFGAEPPTKLRSLPKSEPALCFVLAPEGQITIGQAVELCGGTTDAEATLQCFKEAWGNPADGGLGLTLGQAVDLCKSNSRE